jgi:SM-20-related protein
MSLADAVYSQGFGVVDDFLAVDVVAQLRTRLLQLRSDGAMQTAGIGRAGVWRQEPSTRGDATFWLERATEPAEHTLLAALESVRLGLNRELQLGLVDFEGHYACYPPGARYEQHRDRHDDADPRVLSTVVYLNDYWHAADGGVLRIYLDAQAHFDVAPLGARLVVFLSDRFDHEVLPAARERLSFAGWFRRRTALIR